MVLVDTSVWVAHLRHGKVGLDAFLNNGQVVCHPFVIGELACGNLQHRSEILSLLATLPLAFQASPEEVLEFIDRHRLMGRGLGYIDMHLLASARLTGVSLWTLDKKLHEAAKKLGVVPPDV
jgi:predicted nucleic acid-binding protein